MTAFDDILKAEQEAEKSIATAKEEVAEAIVKARGERKTKIETETARLKEVEESALNKHQGHISDLTSKIEKEVEVQVASVENKFESHKVELRKTLKNKFA